MTKNDFLAIDENSKGIPVMHARKFLHGLLGNTIHKLRKDALIEAVLAAIDAKKLSLTAIGRAISTGIQDRSGIQKVNRLLGNPHLFSDRMMIFTKIAATLIGAKKSCDILVDWTKYPESADVVLRASLAADGRSLTLYEERHPQKKLGNRRVQKTFLQALKDVLPIKCKPVIITDAGFYNHWFSEVQRNGWDYIGRVRGMRKYCRIDEKKFIECSKLWKQAGVEAKSLGEVILTEQNPFQTRLYLIKGKLTGRKVRTKAGKVRRDKDSINYGRSHREPWLLASSLKGRSAAKSVTNKYKLRMQIEQEFRDLKGKRYGFGLEESKTKMGDRRSILLLIGMLSSLVAWTIGAAAEKMGLHCQFQSNSIKNRRVISLVYLGCRIIKKRLKIAMRHVWDSLHQLRKGAVV